MRKLILVAIITAFWLVPAAAIAQQYEGETGSLGVSDTNVAPGGSVTMSGSGFASGSSVVITIESEPRTLGTVTANDDGKISATVDIPSDLSAGTHTLKATGVTPDGATLVLSASVSIAGSDADVVAGTGTDDLAGTGSRLRIDLMAGAAAVLLAIGIVSLVTARRRARI